MTTPLQWNVAEPTGADLVFLHALRAADVLAEWDFVDGEHRLDLGDGGRIVAGYEPVDREINPDLPEGAEWWTATHYLADGSEREIYNGPDMGELVAEIVDTVMDPQILPTPPAQDGS